MLPERTGDTMSDAIALSSPSGRMSKRARSAAQKRLSVALFGENGLTRSPYPTVDRKEYLLHRAKYLRELAACGMSRRAFTREADQLEAEARSL